MGHIVLESSSLEHFCSAATSQPGLVQPLVISVWKYTPLLSSSCPGPSLCPSGPAAVDSSPCPLRLIQHRVSKSTLEHILQVQGLFPPWILPGVLSTSPQVIFYSCCPPKALTYSELCRLNPQNFLPSLTLCKAISSILM